MGRRFRHRPFPLRLLTGPSNDEYQIEQATPEQQAAAQENMDQVDRFFEEHGDTQDTPEQRAAAWERFRKKEAQRHGQTDNHPGS